MGIKFGTVKPVVYGFKYCKEKFVASVLFYAFSIIFILLFLGFLAK